ncbi:MAG: D-glycero-beta-D-manno-heptose-7-phosphate kinase, partial [Candidatus Cloacimonetes bacterium]|nr:D-glycero-beta-D-manno-heptose-7-phosphate kinase [Candidatus Cloacimonadota bacterium]
MKDFKPILNRFSQCMIAVIGDLILDEYIFGQVDRISPEAPVPIVRVTSEKYALGGAANVAANLATLRGNVYLFGVTGDDPARQIMLERARFRKIDTSGILIDQRKPTVRKTRIISLNQQLLRIDHENIAYIESHLENSFLQQLEKISNLDAVIISDYAKGTVTRELLTGLKQFCQQQKIRLIIDPRPKHKPWYQQADLIT